MDESLLKEFEQAVNSCENDDVLAMIEANPTILQECLTALPDLLIQACDSENLAAGELLLQAGYSINQGYSIFPHNTALSRLVCVAESNEVIEWVIKKGGDIQTPFGYKGTCLLAAIMDQNVERIRLLFDSGQDLSFCFGIRGELFNAYSWCKARGYDDTARELERRGVTNPDPNVYADNVAAVTQKYHELGTPTILEQRVDFTYYHVQCDKSEFDYIGTAGFSRVPLEYRLPEYEFCEFLLPIPKMDRNSVRVKYDWVIEFIENVRKWKFDGHLGGQATLISAEDEKPLVKRSQMKHLFLYAKDTPDRIVRRTDKMLVRLYEGITLSDKEALYEKLVFNRKVPEVLAFLESHKVPLVIDATRKSCVK